MCLDFPTAPSAKIVENSDPRGAAAADALQMRRKNAQGFQSSVLGGVTDTAQPSLARQLLGAG